MEQVRGRRVYVAGHRGMVGSALVRRLEQEDCRVVTAGREVADLRRQTEAEELLRELRPDLVFLAAARVGGILANSTYPADFLYDNLMIEANVIRAAHLVGVKKLLLLGSSCIYPKHAPQPIPEDALLTGPLEPTNEWYAIAKIAGIKLVQACRRQYGSDFIAVQPANLYGPGDNFDAETSHVTAALLQRFDEAKRLGSSEVVVWGSGNPRREFLYVEDLADACVFAMKHYSDDRILNVGTGCDLSIAELANLIAEIVGYHGTIVFDPSKPDGTPQKLLDTSRMTTLGWQASVSLREGLDRSYADYVAKMKRVSPPAQHEPVPSGRRSVIDATSVR